MLESDICTAASETPDGMTATRDLQRAIAAGDFPQYNLFVQALDPGRMHTLGFYPLDATKVGGYAVFMCWPVVLTTVLLPCCKIYDDISSKYYPQCAAA